MIRYLLLVLACGLTTSVFSHNNEAQEEFFPSTPEQVATLSSEPCYLVGGVISPLSGSPVLKEVDMIVKGAQEIVLNRIYISPGPVLLKIINLIKKNGINSTFTNM